MKRLRMIMGPWVLLAIAVSIGCDQEDCVFDEPDGGANPGPPPNIVFVLMDDARWDGMSNMNHPYLETPNLDRLADQGVKFTNAFVTTSLCSPSRATFLTGVYAHIHGTRENGGGDPGPQTPIFPAQLQAAGYETAFIGKWHMSHSSDPREGFDYWLSFSGQGQYINPTLNENGLEFKAEGYMTDLLTEYALNWLAQPRDKPFCLLLWHKATHAPFTPAPRHQDLYAGQIMPEPATYSDPMADEPDWLRRSVVYGEISTDVNDHINDPTPETLEPPLPWTTDWEMRLNYHRTIVAVDDSVGRILDFLTASDQLNSTAVVYSSDNGYLLGEHRRWDKRIIFEESIRIPLLMRYPRLAQAGSTVDKMVLSNDLAPTFLEMAGVSAQNPDPAQGRSVLPLLKGEAPEWRTAFLYEYFMEGWVPGLPTVLSVRTENWKYASYPDLPNDIPQLFDLTNDPIELHNLALDPAYAERMETMDKALNVLLSDTNYQ